MMSGHQEQRNGAENSPFTVQRKRRPDLLKKADLTNKEWNYVRQLKKQWKEEEEQTK